MFCFLSFQIQACYDLCYLFLNVPAFVVPAFASESFQRKMLPLMPVVLPMLHIFLTGKMRLATVSGNEKPFLITVHLSLFGERLRTAIHCDTLCIRQQ